MKDIEFMAFEEELKQAHQEFVVVFNKLPWNNELWTKAESFFILYNQLADRHKRIKDIVNF